jgi:hypothetical protein
MKIHSTFSFIFFFSLVTHFSSAQDIEYKDYSWDTEPKFEVPVTEGDESEFVVKEKRVLEYVFEGNYFFQYDLKHTVTYIASEAGVEENNKIYLTTRSDQEVIYQKARVINSKNEVIEFDENDIQEGEDEESGLVFNYFALDGLDIGSFVELQFLVKKNSSHSGSRVLLQSTVPKKNVEFELIAPNHLIFDFLPLNGLPALEQDTTLESKNYWKLKMATVPKFEIEEIAYVTANLMGLVYKLNKNYYTGQSDLTSYGEAAKNYYEGIYGSTSKSEKKKVKKLLKKIGISDKMSDTDKILSLENHLKAAYAIYPNVQPQYQGIGALLENKASDRQSFIRLYALAFEQLEISHQLVLTSDRTSLPFNKEFEAYNYLQSTLFYFTDLDKYLDPEATQLRLGYVPSEYMNNYGLFIKPLNIGGITTGLGKVKFIKALGNELTANNHYVKVDMTEDPFEPVVDYELRMSGYYSSFIQTIYDLLSDDERERLNESLVEMVATEKTDAELTVENGNAESFGKKPMILKATVSSTDVCEKAGNKVIFKIGQLIGRQVELYNEKPRQLPVQSDYNRTYYREIVVQLPEFR